VWGSAPGQRGLIVSEEPASATRQQSNDADLLSVGFPTGSTRMWTACPSCNTVVAAATPNAFDAPAGCRAAPRSTRPPALGTAAWSCVAAPSDNATA
jgi:hypothetical protein